MEERLELREREERKKGEKPRRFPWRLAQWVVAIVLCPIVLRVLARLYQSYRRRARQALESVPFSTFLADLTAGRVSEVLMASDHFDVTAKVPGGSRYRTTLVPMVNREVWSCVVPPAVPRYQVTLVALPFLGQNLFEQLVASGVDFKAKEGDLWQEVKHAFVLPHQLMLRLTLIIRPPTSGSVRAGS